MSSYDLGIDISKYQGGKVDFVKAKENGVKFVFIRIGYSKTKDPYFDIDYASAIKAGLKVGAYYYTISTDIAGAIEDATRVLGWLNDRHLDFPIAYDVEDKKQSGTSRKLINANMYNAFAQKIEKSGVYDAILYSGEYFYNNYFEKSEVVDDLWIARYSTRKPSVGRDISVWQFTSDYLTSSYYNGKLDRNYLLKEFNPSREAEVKPSLNPYPVPTRLLKKTVPCMKGNDVKWLQWELTERGYSIGDIDGIFGNITKQCVKIYQLKRGLKQDGIVGTATIYQLTHE